MHRATAAIINGTNVLLKFKQEHDVEAIIQRQRVLFEEVVTTKLDVVVRRVDDDMKDLRAELKLMKARMAEIEIALGIKLAP
jgi:CHASE1-domain containing sensor protein